MGLPGGCWSVMVCGCSSPSAAPAAGPPAAPARRPARRPPSAAPATTTTGPPSAVPTTVPIPPGQAPGWSPTLTTLPPGGGFTLALVHLGHLLHRRRRRNQRRSIRADRRVGGGPVVGRGLVVRSLVYFPAPATGPVTAPVLPAVTCTSGPSCVIVDGSGHVSNGDGTDWSAPIADAAGPVDAGQPGRPGSRTPRLTDRPSSARHPPSAPSSTTPARPTPSKGGHWLAAAVVRGPGPGAAASRLPLPGRAGRGLVPDRRLVHRGGRHARCSTGTAPPGPRSRRRGPPRWLGPSDPTAISCPTTSLCAIVNGSGVSLGRTGRPVVGARRPSTRTGSSTRSRARPPPSAWPPDSGGSVVTWNGTSWTAPDQVHPGGHRVPGHRHVRVVPEPAVLHGHQRGRRLRHLLGLGAPRNGHRRRPSGGRSARLPAGPGSADHAGQLGQGGDRPPVAGGGRDPRRRSR